MRRLVVAVESLISVSERAELVGYVAELAEPAWKV